MLKGRGWSTEGRVPLERKKNDVLGGSIVKTSRAFGKASLGGHL